MGHAPESSVALPPEQGRAIMAATLHFFYPTTRQQVPTDIKTDVQGLRASWRSIVNVDCPHCGQVHEISVRAPPLRGPWQAGALARAAMPPRRGGLMG